MTKLDGEKMQCTLSLCKLPADIRNYASYQTVENIEFFQAWLTDNVQALYFLGT